jgi:hypothetical protein
MELVWHLISVKNKFISLTLRYDPLSLRLEGKSAENVKLCKLMCDQRKEIELALK